jgi:hypothetical protein
MPSPLHALPSALTSGVVPRPGPERGGQQVPHKVLEERNRGLAHFSTFISILTKTTKNATAFCTRNPNFHKVNSSPTTQDGPLILVGIENDPTFIDGGWWQAGSVAVFFYPSTAVLRSTAVFCSACTNTSPKSAPADAKRTVLSKPATA